MLEPTKEYIPSNVQINWDEDTKEVKLWNVYRENQNKLPREWTFPAASIKGVRSVVNKSCGELVIYS